MNPTNTPFKARLAKRIGDCEEGDLVAVQTSEPVSDQVGYTFVVQVMNKLVKRVTDSEHIDEYESIKTIVASGSEPRMCNIEFGTYWNEEERIGIGGHPVWWDDIDGTYVDGDTFEIEKFEKIGEYQR